MKKHSSEKPEEDQTSYKIEIAFECELCEETFPESNILKNHERMVHKIINSCEKPHQCGICKSSFIWLASLKKHKLVHK